MCVSGYLVAPVVVCVYVSGYPAVVGPWFEVPAVGCPCASADLVAPAVGYPFVFACPVAPAVGCPDVSAYLVAPAVGCPDASGYLVAPAVECVCDSHYPVVVVPGFEVLGLGFVVAAEFAEFALHFVPVNP